MIKADIISEIQALYDPDAPTKEAADKGKDLINEIANKRGEMVDLTKWKSLLNAFLEELLLFCQRMDNSDKLNAARIAHGETQK